MVETTFNLREVFVFVEISVRMKPIRQLDKVDLHLSYTFNSALIRHKKKTEPALQLILPGDSGLTIKNCIQFKFLIQRL